MNLIFMVIEKLDTPTKFIFLFQFFSVITLIISHHFLYKKHKKLWLALCTVPLLVSATFFLLNTVKGNFYFGYQRYILVTIISVLILIWGLASYFRKYYVAYTVMLSILSVACLAMGIVPIIFTNYAPHFINLTHYTWTKSFEKAIDDLEKNYISKEWKEIDFDKLRSELVPKVKKAEEENDKAQFAMALYELKYRLYDGHIIININEPQIKQDLNELMYGNDYGFVMFKDNSDEYIAVMVDETLESEIHNGTVITKWNNVPVEKALLDVKCIDDEYLFSYIENEDIFRPMFLSGMGEDKVSVSFIDDNGEEKQVTLHSKGCNISRLHSAISKVYADNFNNENYYTCMLNENCGYLRMTAESFYKGDLEEYLASLTGDYPKLRNDIEAKIEELEKQGMDRMIIDLRNNRGGYDYISQNISSLFIDKPMMTDAAFCKNGKFESYEESRVLGTGRWSNIPVAVLVNGETGSAGDCFAYWLSSGDNTYVVGNTYSWGCAQGTGAICYLSDDLIEFKYPIFPSITNEYELIAEAKADRKARIKLDYQITYDKDGVLKLFSDSTDDDVLEKTIEFISSK